MEIRSSLYFLVLKKPFSQCWRCFFFGRGHYGILVVNGPSCRIPSPQSQSCPTSKPVYTVLPFAISHYQQGLYLQGSFRPFYPVRK